MLHDVFSTKIIIPTSKTLSFKVISGTSGTAKSELNAKALRHASWERQAWHRLSLSDFKSWFASLRATACYRATCMLTMVVSMLASDIAPFQGNLSVEKQHSCGQSTKRSLKQSIHVIRQTNTSPSQPLDKYCTRSPQILKMIETLRQRSLPV